MAWNKTVVAAGVIGSLLGLFIGSLIGIAMGNRVAMQMWAGPDYVDRLLDRCWFEEMIAVDAKRQGLARFDSSSASLESCRNFIDFASENLAVSEQQKLRLRQHKATLLRNFPYLALPPAAVKLSPEEQARLRQAKEDVLRNLPEQGVEAKGRKPEAKP